MADNNAGKVELEVEFDTQSVNSEASKVGNSINSSFRGMFSGIAGQTNNFVKGSMSKIGDSFKNFAQSGAGSNEKVTQSASKLNSEYDKTQQKVKEINAELNNLYAKMDVVANKYASFPALTGRSKGETIEQLLGTDTEYQKLSEEATKLESKLSPLTSRSNELSSALSKSGAASHESGIKIGRMGNYAKKAIGSISGLTGFKKLLTHETNRASNATSKFGTTMHRVSRMILRNLIVYGLIIKGLKAMVKYTWSALKTNQQFANSLNIIKTNLLVAFQPIYEFILPALNALMKGIATVTTYIASAISALFGKTYKQSYNTAKSMNTAIGKMGGAGKAVKGVGKEAKKAGKELKGMLMPIDEINQLDSSKDKDNDSTGGGGDAGGTNMTMPDLATIDTSGIDKFKQTMSSIFEPFKLAWENEGQATIESIKYALGSVGGLIKAIGKSWLEVWTNGTGQAIIETMLRILQNIFGLVGDIAQSFTNAWNNAGLGTSIMQHIHNVILNVLTLVERLSGAFREVWKEVGDEFANAVLENIDGVLGALDNLTKNLVKVWDNGGKHLFKSFIKLGAKILEISYFINTEFVIPFIKWFMDMIAPAISTVCDWVGKLFDVFSGLIDWLMGDGKPVLDVIVTVLGSMAAAFGIVKGAVKIFHGVMGAFNGVMKLGHDGAKLFGGVIGWIKSPIGIAVLAIGTIIAIGVLLYKHWDEISAWLKELWQGIKDKAVEIWNGIKDFFVNTWNSIHDKTVEIWTKIKTHVLNKWNEIKQEIINKKDALVNAIMKPFHIAKDKIHDVIASAKDWGKNLIGMFIDGIKSMIGKVKGAVKSVAKTISEHLGFHSPAKKGPASDSDKWMPNLMGMLADGIEDNIYEVQGAVNLTAQAIQGVQPKPDSMVDNIKSGISDGITSAMSGNDRPITVKSYVTLPDGKVLGEAVAEWNNGRVNQGLPSPILV